MQSSTGIGDGPRSSFNGTLSRIFSGKITPRVDKRQGIYYLRDSLSSRPLAQTPQAMQLRLGLRDLGSSMDGKEEDSGMPTEQKA